MTIEIIDDNKTNWLLWSINISCLVGILCALYFLYFKKDYDFVVEVACDPTKEICFERNCSNPDDCPPNKLSDFKRYILKARDFSMCENENCASVCENGTIKCKPIKCVENLDDGESCSVPENTTNK
jgi:hypothetical protein